MAKKHPTIPKAGTRLATGKPVKNKTSGCVMLASWGRLLVSQQIIRHLGQIGKNQSSFRQEAGKGCCTFTGFYQHRPGSNLLRRLQIAQTITDKPDTAQIRLIMPGNLFQQAGFRRSEEHTSE